MNIYFRFIIILSYISLLSGHSCKTSDFTEASLLKSGKCDFYYSPEEFQKIGIKGYAKIWDQNIPGWRIFEYTYMNCGKFDSTYYQHFDRIYLGRGLKIEKDSI